MNIYASLKLILLGIAGKNKQLDDGDLKIVGLHATSKSRADKIKEAGFNVSMGRAGIGVYFWRGNSDLTRELARAWHLQQCVKGTYKSDSNSELSIFQANLTLNDEDFLDLEDPEIKDEIQALGIERGIDKVSKDTDIAGFVSMFVEEFEKITRSEVKVFQIRVGTPDTRYLNKYSIVAYGAPICYVVRDKTTLDGKFGEI